MRTYGGAYFTRAERRWLFALRVVCRLRGHDDRWVDWWNSTALRCERCLQFVTQPQYEPPIARRGGTTRG